MSAEPAPQPDASGGRPTADAQTLPLRIAIDNISQGVCLFDSENRLVLCNRPYAEIYRLTPDQVLPGATLREIVERRIAAGTCSIAVEGFLTLCQTINAAKEPVTWSMTLADGRTVRIHHQPLPDGGWVSTHEDVSEFQDKRAAVDERISLQALVDWVPDNLWVKDLESRFVVANKATASRMGFSGFEELIGKTDLELCPPEAARGYLADERRVIESGQPMIDKEEYVIGAHGEKRWILTTKVPLRNAKDEIFGLVGVSRDITERRRADALRDGQAGILEMMATKAPLETVLEELMHLVESQAVGMFAAAMLVEPDGLHLRHVAAPSLPPAYTKAVDAVGVRLGVEPCGAAVQWREAVVADIAEDSLWKTHRQAAASQGYRWCWSTPILASHGAALGGFALYSMSMREPTEAERRLMYIVSNIAAIAIERKLADDRNGRA